MLLTKEQMQSKYPCEAVRFMQSLEMFHFASTERNEFGFYQVKENAPEEVKREYVKYMEDLSRYVDRGYKL